MKKEKKTGPYFGVIEIGKITNEQKASGKKKMEGEELLPLKESNVKFVHYPDCQQLITWLTHPGREYGNIRLVNSKTKKIIEEWPVIDKLSGSIQVTWDTLHIAPGNYIMEIDWKNGWRHGIAIKKNKEGILPKEKKTSPVKKEKEKGSKPIQYRDGFGKLTGDEDLVIRAKAQKDITRRFTRYIEYEGNLRSGTVIYIDSAIRIGFNNEMGGGNCMCYLDIPTEAQWEKYTGTALSSRKEILEFVAGRVQAEQASNCRYEIKSNTISFYYK